MIAIQYNIIFEFKILKYNTTQKYLFYWYFHLFSPIYKVKQHKTQFATEWSISLDVYLQILYMSKG